MKLLEKNILTELKDEYVFFKNYIYQKDFSNRILKAFCFEKSSFSKNGFYLWVFVQPLYIPFDYIFLTFGRRLKTQENKEWWDSSTNDLDTYFMDLHDSIIRIGIPFLNQVNSPKTFFHFFKTKKDTAVNIHEGVCYTLFYLMDKEAYKEAQLLLDHIRQTQNCEISWVKAMINRTELLLNSDLIKANEILKEWEKGTVKNLKLK